MRVFVQNPERFRDKFSAERELIRRFELAGKNLGIEIGGGFSAEEARTFKPELILATHPYVAKTEETLTLGCLWNPIRFMEAVAEFKPNTRSYDGFLYASERLKEWTRDLVMGTTKHYLESVLYPSSPRTPYSVPKRFELPVYVGTNWDGERHSALLMELARRRYLRVYGPSSRWQRVRELGGYYGEIEFGSDVLMNTYREAAIGLCLHHSSHLEDAVPNMRVFEIIASCALPICDQHDFIKNAFGDSVLYVDTGLSPENVAQQIIDHVDWIRAHPRPAAEMIEQAHRTFCEQFCLEALLTQLLEHVQRQSARL
ncbi:MAG TPA: hypothetical protein V6C86_02770 [Oculatellaceae cyanobacterium]